MSTRTEIAIRCDAGSTPSARCAREFKAPRVARDEAEVRTWAAQAGWVRTAAGRDLCPAHGAAQ